VSSNIGNFDIFNVLIDIETGILLPQIFQDWQIDPDEIELGSKLGEGNQAATIAINFMSP
jgi:hypothetical protein